MLMTQRSEPNEKNQNSSDAQNRWWSAACEKLLKNARVKIQAGGNEKERDELLQPANRNNPFCLRTFVIRRRYRSSSRRRRFLTVESNDFADYQRAGKKAEPQRAVQQNPVSLEIAKTALCAAHVGPDTSVDSDDFSLFNEKGNLNRFASFEFCRLLDIVRAIAADSFSGLNHF